MGLRVTHAAIEARADYALTGKATGLGLATPDGTKVDPGTAGSTNEFNAFLVRKAHLFGVSAHIPVAGIPLPRDMASGAASGELDRSRSIIIPTELIVRGSTAPPAP